MRAKVTGGTAGPISRPISRYSQFRSMPATLKMQDRAPVMHANDEINNSQGSFCGNQSACMPNMKRITRKSRAYP